MKLKILIFLISVISVIATAVIYPQLPEKIPVHWNIYGEIDRYSDKAYAFLLAAIPFIMLILMRLIPKIDPRRDSYQKHKKAYEIVILSIVLFMIGVHWASMLAALNFLVDVSFLVKMFVGILFIITGNYMTQVKHNYTFGIRTPWTLASETVWHKTHRVGAYLFFICGFIWFALSVVNKPVVFFILISLTVGMSLYLIIFSYFLFEKERKSSENENKKNQN
ncbi:MAG: SdpI family protein [Spirochaetia bacterium]|nr:SdpI family protein [Spirochaetia bacterium]